MNDTTQTRGELIASIIAAALILTAVTASCFIGAVIL